MMKKMFLMFGLLAILLVFSSLAYADAQLSETVSFDQGVTTISWTGSPSQAYHVFIKCMDSIEGTAQPYQIVDTNVLNQCKTGLLIPGHSYEVTLVDSAFRIEDIATYSIPSADTFQDGKLKDSSIKVTVETRKKDLQTNQVSKISELSAKAIIKDDLRETAQYGVKYHMQMPQLIKNRSFYIQLAFIAPNGMIYSYDVGDVSFERVADGYQNLWWNFIGQDFFEEELDLYSTILSGKYTIELYWDGMLVNRSYFHVY